MTDTTPPERRSDDRRDERHDQRPDAWAAAPAAAPTATLSPPPPSWYGTPTPAPAPATGPGSAPAGRSTPHPPWFWPVIAAAIGLGALLVGGGVGFAVGHAVASHGVSSFTGPGGAQYGPRGQSGSGQSGPSGNGTDGSGSTSNGSTQELPGGATVSPQGS